MLTCGSCELCRVTIDAALHFAYRLAPQNCLQAGPVNLHLPCTSPDHSSRCSLVRKGGYHHR